MSKYLSMESKALSSAKSIIPVESRERTVLPLGFLYLSCYTQRETEKANHFIILFLHILLYFVRYSTPTKVIQYNNNVASSVRNSHFLPQISASYMYTHLIVAAVGLKRLAVKNSRRRRDDARASAVYTQKIQEGLNVLYVL